MYGLVGDHYACARCYRSSRNCDAACDAETWPPLTSAAVSSDWCTLGPPGPVGLLACTRPVPQHAPQSHSYRLPWQTAVHSPANFCRGQPRLNVLIQPTLSRPRAVTMPTMAFPRKDRELPQYFRIASDIACRTPANPQARNPYLRSAAARSPSRSHESNSATSLPSDSEVTTR